jgi:hypothetical protein
MGETGVERQGKREGERTVVLIEFWSGGSIKDFVDSVLCSRDSTRHPIQLKPALSRSSVWRFTFILHFISSSSCSSLDHHCLSFPNRHLALM